jgi:4'-phosphopantetheinyl transferase
VEHIRPLSDMADVARRFFSAGEYEDLMAVEIAERERAFFRCWTHKEAYIKAVGDGLSLPLDRFRVSLRPDEPARFLQLPPDPGIVPRWTLRDVSVETGYVAALAYPGEERPVLVQPALDADDLISIGRL